MLCRAVTCRRTTLDGYQQFLDLFIAHGRRPLAPVDIARWRLMRGAQDVCDAFTQQPPDTLDRAQACLCYIQAGGRALRC